jgi:class I fructose-bisphosphate aldolase
MSATASIDRIQELLGDEADSLLSHVCGGVPKEKITAPGPDHVDRVFKDSDRNARVLVNLQRMFDHGRLGGSGYLSILPVDQGIEHSGASAFGPNVDLFDPENIVRLAVEGGCNGVASTVGALGSLSRRWAHKIPFIVKLNHNELMTYPNSYEQILFASVEQAWELGAAAVGATVYFGGEDGRRELVEIAEAFAHGGAKSQPKWWNGIANRASL